MVSILDTQHVYIPVEFTRKFGDFSHFTKISRNICTTKSVYCHVLIISLYVVTDFDQETYGQFKRVGSWQPKFTNLEKFFFAYKLFYFPGKIDDLPSWYGNS